MYFKLLIYSLLHNIQIAIIGTEPLIIVQKYFFGLRNDALLLNQIIETQVLSHLQNKKKYRDWVFA